SGFTSGTRSPLPTSCVMLYRHPVPFSVGSNCPAETKASGAAASTRLTIFILRLGKCQNSRSVNVVRFASDTHSDTRWQFSFNHPAMKLLFGGEPQPRH